MDETTEPAPNLRGSPPMDVEATRQHCSRYSPWIFSEFSEDGLLGLYLL